MTAARPGAAEIESPVPTLEDVAAAAGVSTATVSRCFNSPTQVSDKTRERVMQVVRDLGYAPNFSARALAAKPSIMLLDEPFAGIDPIAVAELQQIVKRLQEKGIGVLITDHSVRETLQITNRAYIISQGQIFRHGTPAELASDAEVRRVYLGEQFRLD